MSNIADLHDVDDADEFVGGVARNSRRRSDTRLSPTEAEDLRATSSSNCVALAPNP